MADIQAYKCPCCGGSIEFNSKLQKLKCPYCDSEFDVETLEENLETAAKSAAEDRFENWNTEGGEKWTEEDAAKVNAFICQSCGGEIIGDANTGATTCPYCGNNVVIPARFADALKPDLVIPFRLDKKAAKEALTRHLQKKKLLPKLFRSENHIDEVQGIYVPFWLYGGEVQGSVKYAATRVRHWSTQKYNYTETSYFDVYREGSLAFENIPADASSKMADDLMDSLEPFDFSKAVDFNTAYLAGFLADKYDVSADDDLPRVNVRVKQSAQEAFRETVTEAYDMVSVKNASVALVNGQAKYALLPVWVLNTNWKGQKYVFAMNGQSGKFVGNLPMDKKLYWKYWFRAFCCALPLGVVIGLLIKWLG